MNRLVILGNGFDLAHGLPTRYEDFMLHYMRDIFTKRHDASGLMSVKKRGFTATNWNDVVYDYSNVSDLLKYMDTYNNIVGYKTNSNFLKELLDTQNNNNWIDIEAEYYRLLKECISEKSMELKSRRTYKAKYTIEDINKDFEILKSILEIYLKKEVEENYRFVPSESFLNIFLTKRDTVKRSTAFSSGNEYPDKTVFLNFNYTSLIEEYLIQPEMIHNLKESEVIYIHGELENSENPIIFGFGDEMDKSYQEIEELNNNAYFEHIKSFQYLKTSNYQDLIRFLDGSTEGYEIYIIGHSCGLSDRTLLNHVFEHNNCKSIKIFYHKNLKGYTNTVYEISRHFNDKSKMRTKIVPFEKSIPTPQVQLKKNK